MSCHGACPMEKSSMGPPIRRPIYTSFMRARLAGYEQGACFIANHPFERVLRLAQRSRLKAHALKARRAKGCAAR